MKKMFLVFGVIGIVTMGCKKSGSSPNYTATIVGKWKQTSAIIWYEPKTGAVQKDTTFFGSTSYTNFLSNDSVYTYDVYLNTGQSPDTASGIYSLSGSTLSITISGSTITHTIQSLTSNSLTVYTKSLDVDSAGGTGEEWTYFVK